MARFIVNVFGGIAPMVSKRLLSERLAQRAVNCNLTSGELRPLKSNLKIGDGLLSKTGPILSMYRFGQEQGETQFWFHWDVHVDVVRGYVNDDVNERTYFTGDGVPKMTFSPLAVTGGGTDYPYGSYTLGVIKPDLTTMNMAVSNRGITTITYSTTQATVTTDEPHKLQTGSTVDIIGAGSPDAALYNGQQVVTVVDEDTFTYTMTAEPTANATGTLEFNFGGLAETRLYAVSYVSTLGEEGAPAIASGYIDVIAGQIVSFTGLPTAPTGSYDYGKKRIYRTAAGSLQSTLRYVGEVILATTTFVDDQLGTELDENIESLTYEAPPADLHGLIDFANGMFAGISVSDGNQVCITPPNRPHAYPIEYRYSFNVKPIALGKFGNSIAVLTEGVPWVLTGTSPAGMAQEPVTVGGPCMSARSRVEILQGVAWASDQGIAFIGNGGYDLVTKSHFTEREWKLYDPSSIHAYRWKNRYVGFYDNGTEQGGFIFDFQTLELRELDFYATAGYTNPKNGELYLAIGDEVYKLDSGATDLIMLHKSKVYTTERPANMAYARVEAENYPVTFKMYADGVLRKEKIVKNNRVFSLPTGYTARDFEFEFGGTNAVKGFGVATLVEELAMAIE